tara:strand:+ start:990 stop:1193 length:204 start_codon:yes stop_codon:yes gene_type:complete
MEISWNLIGNTLERDIHSSTIPLYIKEGEVPEWSNGAVSKTVVLFEYPGFESLSLRHFRFNINGLLK